MLRTILALLLMSVSAASFAAEHLYKNTPGPSFDFKKCVQGHQLYAYCHAMERSRIRDQESGIKKRGEK